MDTTPRQMRDVVLSGDWFLNLDTNRYTVAYLAKEDPAPAEWHRRHQVMGYPGAFYAAPVVVEHLVGWVADVNAAMVAEHEAADAPQLSWDGRTLTVEESGAIERHEVRPDGLVRLPAWAWGPVEPADVDRVVG